MWELDAHTPCAEVDVACGAVAHLFDILIASHAIEEWPTNMELRTAACVKLEQRKLQGLTPLTVLLEVEANVENIAD